MDYRTLKLTNKVSVTEVESTITIPNSGVFDYDDYLFDNCGDKEIIITINGTIIKLQSGKYINFAENDVTEVKLQCAAGESSTLFYFIQGDRKVQ